jgi:hypothetical protein
VHFESEAFAALAAARLSTREMHSNIAAEKIIQKAEGH